MVVFQSQLPYLDECCIVFWRCCFTNSTRGTVGEYFPRWITSPLPNFAFTGFQTRGMVRFASLWNYAQIDHTVAGDATYIITSRGQYAEGSRLQSLMLPLFIDSPQARALSAVVIFASQQSDSLVFLLMPAQDRGKPQPGTVSSSSVSTVALLL